MGITGDTTDYCRDRHVVMLTAYYRLPLPSAVAEQAGAVPATATASTPLPYSNPSPPILCRRYAQVSFIFLKDTMLTSDEITQPLSMQSFCRFLFIPQTENRL